MSNSKYWYDKTHTVTFGSKNTWTDWHLIPVSGEIPIPSPPEVKTEYIDVPGADGQLDYTEVLAGVKYQNRQGSWDFYVVLENTTWATVYSDILNYLHGQRMRCVLSDDPGFYYEGRFSLNRWQSDEHWSKITIDYVLDPYKIPLNTTSTYDWLWNELFNNTIYYGRFDVADVKHRNLLNDTASDISIGIRVTSPMTVLNENTSESISLEAGFNNNAATLQPGNNYFTFYGNGRVIVDYSIGRRL